MYTIDKETEMIMMEMMLARRQSFFDQLVQLEPHIVASRGPNDLTFEAAPTECCLCCLLEDDDDSCDEITERFQSEPKPTRRQRTKKPKRTLRDAIKESVRSSESKRDESKQNSEILKADTDKKPTTKKIKNQGKAKTFKRKTKKPGRL